MYSKPAKPTTSPPSPQPLLSTASPTTRPSVLVSHTPESLSPPMSPSAPATHGIHLPFFSGRTLSRSATTDNVPQHTSRSRSKSPTFLPSPPHSLPGAPLKQIQTSPTKSSAAAVPGRRTASASAASPTSPDQSKRPSLSKKTKSPPGSTSHYGRHGNEWLFGGISFRESVKHLVTREEPESGEK